MGACENCHGTGQVREIDESKLVPNENLTIAQGAVASWHLPGHNFMPVVAEHAGVRIHVPFKDLTQKEKDFVLNAPQKKYKMDMISSTGRVFHDFNALYKNAYIAVLDSVNSKSKRAQKRISEFFHYSTCPVCHGTRLKPELLKQKAAGLNIAQVNDLSLGDLLKWRQKLAKDLQSDMHKMADAIFKDFDDNIRPLLELGLDYLTLSRNGNTLSTGELQRIQLARTLRTETTGVLYVLDEPSIGLHPANIAGLLNVFKELVDQGNSLVVVDHNVDIIKAADWIIEIGPGSGSEGGKIIAQGTVNQIKKDPNSKIAPYLNGSARLSARKINLERADKKIDFEVENYFNIQKIKEQIPVNRLTAVTGFSGSGKTSLILDSLVPAIKDQAKEKKLTKQVKELGSPLKEVVSVDASPIGKTQRSTVATYTNIMDNLRKLFANQPLAKKKKYTPTYFSYNNKEGACPNCGGAGVITLDIQFLPDMQQVCPVYNGDRYNPAIQEIKWQGMSIVDVLKLDVRAALKIFKNEKKIYSELRYLDEVGLGYLHLGESTPTLSGGEAQRLKLVKHLNRNQEKTLFVFDEPTIGLHPLDVKTLVHVMQKLLEQGATIVTITHDLNLIVNADYMIDMGPRGGKNGGRIVASGQPLELAKDAKTLILVNIFLNFRTRECLSR